MDCFKQEATVLYYIGTEMSVVATYVLFAQENPTKCTILSTDYNRLFYRAKK